MRVQADKSEVISPRSCSHKDCWDQARRSTFAPSCLALGPREYEMAAKHGLTTREADEQFARMMDHEFYKPKMKWRRVWSLWCRNYTQWSRDRRERVQQQGKSAKVRRSIEKAVEAFLVDSADNGGQLDGD